MKSEKEILDKIKSKGYWEITIRPLKFANRFSLLEAKSLLEKACVHYYGWTVPIVTSNSAQCFFGQNFVEGVFDNYGVIEVWRLYTSGQLVYYRGFIEDWQQGNWYTGFNSRRSGTPPTKVKGIAVTVNEVAMFYQLAKQLIETDKLGDQLRMSIILHDVEERTLATDNPMAVLYEDYTCRIPKIKFVSNYSKRELANYSELALKTLTDIVTIFNWTRDGMADSLKRHLQQYASG